MIYDMQTDIMELRPLTPATWPDGSATDYGRVMAAAVAARDAMVRQIHPSPNKAGAGSCTAGLPEAARQPCCPGCSQKLSAFGKCVKGLDKECECNDT